MNICYRKVGRNNVQYRDNFYTPLATTLGKALFFKPYLTSNPTAVFLRPPFFSFALLDFLYRKFGAGVNGMRGRLIAQWSTLIWESIFLFVFTFVHQLAPAIVVLILFSLGVQMAEGCTYGIVPYVVPDATGAVSGIVGAGGNFGAVLWGLIFRFGPKNERSVFRIISGLVLCLSFVTPLIRIRGYATVFFPPKGEPDSIAEI